MSCYVFTRPVYGMQKVQFGFKQWVFAKASFESKSKWASGQEISMKYEIIWHFSSSLSLREKCPNTEFFLVRIFLYSVRVFEYSSIKTPYF